MASTASNKKVARAAKAGGGVSRRQTSTSWGYYGTLLGISVVGVALIIASVVGRAVDDKPPYVGAEKRSVALNTALVNAVKKYGATSSQAKKAQAKYDDYVNNQHWHSAYAFWDCAKPKGKEWLPLINGENDPDKYGIHAHADGLIHIHPFVQSVAGKNAKMGKFFDATGLDVTLKKMVFPAKDASADGKIAATKGSTVTDGTKCANGKTGHIRVFVFKNNQASTKPTEPIGQPKDIPLGKDEVFVFALIEDGAQPPLPANASALEAPSDVTSATPTTTVAGSTTGASTTVAAATGASTTVAAGTVASTSVPAPSTTKAK